MVAAVLVLSTIVTVLALFADNEPISGNTFASDTMAAATSLSVSGETCAASAVFESVKTKSQAASTSTTITKPTGTVQDDLLVAHISVEGGDPTFATPSGWTQLFNGTGGGDVGVAVYWRLAGGSEPANYTFTWTDSENSEAAMVRYSNVDTTTPIDAWASASGDDDMPLAPTVTTTTANTTVIRLFGSDDNETVTNPTGTTSRYDVSGLGVTTTAADDTQPTAGATGTAQFDIGSNEKWVAATIALSRGGATCYYVVEAYFQNWTSAYSNQVETSAC